MRSLVLGDGFCTLYELTMLTNQCAVVAEAGLDGTGRLDSCSMFFFFLSHLQELILFVYISLRFDSCVSCQELSSKLLSD